MLRSTRNAKARQMAVLAAIMALPLLSGCGQIRSHQGYISDAALTNSVLPGVDNKVSVERTMGRPTFAGQFDDQDWYYVARDTRQLAFAKPRPTEQMVLRIHFDKAGNVQDIQRTGIELVSNINPDSDSTPTLGRDRSFFKDLFGNIGAVGAAGAGGGNNGSNTGGP